MTREEKRIPPHPRRTPRLEGPLTLEGLARVFSDCADFSARPAMVGGREGMRVTILYLAGMVKMERVSDYVLKPLDENRELGSLGEAVAWERMRSGALHSLSVEERSTLDDGAADLINGKCLLLFPDFPRALSFDVGTEEKRAIGAPDNEVSVKGAEDSFVENLRTNTSLVRRHLKAPELKIAEEIVGRQTLTPVDVLWVEGIADPRIVAEARHRLEAIDIDGLLAAGNLEEYLADRLDTPFPLLICTERPDRFCRGLSEGRVGILAEGLPLGYLAPGVLSDFIRTPQDRAQHWLMASALTLLRWFCLLATLYLPGTYVAMVNFHPEMIPVRLALSIMASRRDVPFSAFFETVALLLAFEVLQEAGLRLPQVIGQTVSILGGLVVGSAAVEAKLISPAILVVVAIAGMAGYTMPSQDLSAALRIWRFLFCLLGGTAGLFGMVVGTVLFIGHLAGLESFGADYLVSFVSGDVSQAVFRQPLPKEKLRPAFLRPGNRRKQG